MKLLLAIPLLFSSVASEPRDPPRWALEGEEGNARYSLAEVVAFTLENNLDIQMARLDGEIAGTRLPFAKAIFDTLLEAEVNYAKDRREKGSEIFGEDERLNNYDVGLSKKLPTGTSITLDWTNSRDETGSPFAVINPAYDSEIRVSISQPLAKNFFGMLDRGSVAVVEIRIANADLEVLDRIEQALAEVELAYWDLVLAREDVRIAEGTLEQAKRFYELNREKIDTGLVEKPDLIASEANVHVRETELMIAERDRGTAHNRLKLRMNDTSPVKVVPEEGLSLTEEPADLVESLRRAFAMRRDDQRAKNDIRKRGIELKMAKNSLWPQIDLVGSFARNGLAGEYGTAAGDVFREDNPEYFGGVTFSFPLENRAARSDAAKAKAEKAKALLDLRQVEQEIVRQIDDRVRDVRVAREVALNEITVARLQEEKLEEEKKRYLAGRSSSKVMIDYQTDLLNALNTRARAIAEFRKSFVRLRRAENSLLRQVEEAP